MIGGADGAEVKLASKRLSRETPSPKLNKKYFLLSLSASGLEHRPSGVWSAKVFMLCSFLEEMLITQL